jgi:CBS domain-containing protein
MIAKEMMSKDYIKADKNETISGLIGKLKLKKAKTAVVFDNHRFVGLTNKNLLIKTKLNPSQMKVQRIIEKVPVLKGDETEYRIARLMYGADAHLLPVIEKGILLGVVKSIDLINLIKENKKFSRMKAGEVMGRKSLITIKENDRLGKAIEIMKENKIDRIPVIDNKGEVVSIASMTDIMFDYILQLQSKSEARGIGRDKFKTRAFKDRFEMDGFPIKNIASQTIVDAGPEDPVSRIIDLMREFDISSIILTKEKKPVGIITIRDIIKLLIKRVTF